MKTASSKYLQKAEEKHQMECIQFAPASHEHGDGHGPDLMSTDVERISHCVEDELNLEEDDTRCLHESLECDTGKHRMVAGQQREGECWEFVPE